MKAQPIIDVLVPVYNGERTLQSSLDSILKQSLRDIRVLVVDDGSTDGTAALLAEMARLDARIYPIHKKNGGIVDALNYGIPFCIAPYVARHDADDLASPNRLATQLQFLVDHSDHVGVGANAWHINAQGRRIGSRTFYLGEPLQDPYAVPSVEPYLMHPFLLVRRDALVKAGGYRHCIHSEDTDLYWRLLGEGRLHSLPDMLGKYRIHNASISSASVLSGRIAAVSSQLAALSFRRRDAAIPDISFEKSTRARYEEARSFAKIVDIASEQLTPDERAYLEISASVKFLSLLTYRPYEPEQADLIYIMACINRQRDALSAGNAAAVTEYLSRVAVQLLLRGRLKDAAVLEPKLQHMVACVWRQIKRTAYHARNRIRAGD